MLFYFTARTPAGSVESGSVEAANQDAALRELQQRQYMVLKIGTTQDASVLAREIKFFEHIPHRDKVIFTRQLAVLITAKVPLVQALKVLSTQSENKYLQQHVFEIMNDVADGLALSKAMERHPEIFNTFFVSIVRSAEYSGKLQETLSYLADHIDREYALRSKARNALLYPSFVFAMLVIIGTIMVVYVLPQITAVIKESGQQLPLTTRIIVGSADFLASWWWVFLLGLIIALAVFIQYVRTDTGKKWWDKFRLDLPLFGNLFTKLSLARLMENLATLITAGVPITQALQVAADVAGNEVYKGIVLETMEEVKSGNAISAVFARHAEIPPMVAHMIYVGEQSGRLDYTLSQAARFYEREVNDLVDNLVELILPIVIVVLGIMVGVFVVGIIAPIYQFVQAI